jgi:hypothetical protein
MAGVIVLAGIVAGSCRDASPVHPTDVSGPPPSPAQQGRTVAQFVCMVDVQMNRSRCEPKQSAPRTGAAHDAIITNENGYVTVELTNRLYTRSDSTYAADVRISVNDDQSRTLGTRDGTTVLGFKAFFNKGPAAFWSRYEPTDTTWPGVETV